MIWFLLLVIIQSANSAVPMIREQDPMVVAIDDIAGLLYEVPEYEYPELIEHQLENSLGGMPVFTLLEIAKKQGHFKDEVPQREKIMDASKSIDDIIHKLQETRSKLEKGIDNVYTDIQKSIQNLKKLERIFRPDVRQLLQTAMSFAKPLMIPDILEVLPTKGPVTTEASLVSVKPEIYEHKQLSVRIISNFKPVPRKATESESSVDASETSSENPNENDKSDLKKSTEYIKGNSSAYEKSEESAISKLSSGEESPVYIPTNPKSMEDYALKKSLFESDTNKKRNKKVEDPEQMTLFQPKWSWKSEQSL